MIWTDKARGSIVVGCRRCPGSRQLVNTPGEADSWAVDHVARVHPPDEDTRRAVTASRARERRRDTP